MADTVTIARPYAQALFRLAQEGGALAVWSARLQRLADIVDDKEMAKLLGNPKFSAGQIADLVLSIMNEAGDKEVSSFVRLLSDNERFGVVAEIQNIFEELKSADAGVKEAVVISAFPLDDAQLNNLMGQLESHFASKLQPRLEVDAALIGGVRVAVGDQVLDASVRGKLDAMAAALKN